jgi:hypothetical protein
MSRAVSVNAAAGESAADSFVDVSSSYGHLHCFQRLLPLVLKTNPHTYLSTADPADPLGKTWLEIALVAMDKLRLGRSARVRDVAIIGTGSGLDAVGISHIFAPERIVASDIHPRALDAAKWNMAGYARPGTRCEVLLSDLFRAYPAESRFDLAYENLPNVPEDTALLDGIRAASCYSPASYRSDPDSDRHLLTLHYNCLVEALGHLNPDGWIVSMIGGRVPWSVIADMFIRAGFTPVVLNFALKTQSEPGVVLEGYARAERNGSFEFTYYHPIDACAGILARYGTEAADPPEPTTATLNGELQRYRVSARDALRLHQRGERVCHSVYAVGATPTRPSGPRE